MTEDGGLQFSAFGFYQDKKQKHLVSTEIKIKLKKKKIFLKKKTKKQKNGHTVVFENGSDQ